MKHYIWCLIVKRGNVDRTVILLNNVKFFFKKQFEIYEYKLNTIKVDIDNIGAIQCEFKTFSSLKDIGIEQHFIDLCQINSNAMYFEYDDIQEWNLNWIEKLDWHLLNKLNTIKINFVVDIDMEEEVTRLQLIPKYTRICITIVKIAKLYKILKNQDLPIWENNNIEDLYLLSLTQRIYWIKVDIDLLDIEFESLMKIITASNTLYLIEYSQ